MTGKQILSSKVAIGLLIILLAFLANSKFRQWQQARAIAKLKDDLIKQADLQQKKNDQLSDSVAFINSSDFKEQVARQQLNLKRDGEVVYSFTPSNATTADTPASDATTADNAQKWWAYFFQ